LNIYKSVHLIKGREQSVLRNHPWVFSGAIKSSDKGIKDGEVVNVCDWSGKVIAIGHYQHGGSITVRILTKDSELIDEVFWVKRIGNAFSFRKNTLNLPVQTTNTYRLIHGEGDLLPGLVVDIYHDTAVVQCHTQGMYAAQKMIASAIQKCSEMQINHIYTKNKEALHNDKTEDGWLTESRPMPIKVLENGHTFLVDVETGQKTGFFLDQRDNRSMVGHFSKGKSVLNCFCYTGGFSVYALKMGASKVTSVDISKTAMEVCERNIMESSNDERHESVTANILEYLKSEDVPQYEIVITDPPAFAKSIAKRHNAVQAYKRLNVLALQQVNSGGLLFTFSCSQVVGTQLFYDTIVAAAIESGRKIRVMHHLSQGADHPVNLFHPEGHYLKGLALYVE